MTIDRAARARRRWASRAAQPTFLAPPERRLARGTMEIDTLFNPGRKHQIEHLDWVAVAKEDERASGEGPLDLNSGVVRIARPD